MKSLKALVLGTTVAAGVAVVGLTGTNASAHSAYTVQQGDTLAKISQKFAGDYSLITSIASANGIANANLIYTGTTLTIPSKSTTTQATTYTAPAQQTTYKAPAQQQKVQQVAYKAPVQKQTTQQTTYKAPAQKQTTQQTTYKAPAQKQTTQQTTYKAPAQKQTTYKKAAVQQQTTQATTYKSTTTSSTAGSSSAKSWIANKESSNSYSARSATGKYIGKYQLDKSYLNGDYSAANQERVANNYVKQRYGSWDKAKAFHQANGWY